MTEACERFFRRHPTNIDEVLEALDLPFTPEKQLAAYEVLRARILSYPHESFASNGAVEKRSEFGTVIEWTEGGVRANKHIPYADGLPCRVAGRVGQAGFELAYTRGSDVVSTVYGTLIRLRSFPPGGDPRDPRPTNVDFRLEHHLAREDSPERVVFESAYGLGRYQRVFELSR